MRLRELLFVGCLGALVVAALGAPVAAQTVREEFEVTTTKTAWYAQAPPCTSVDCSVLPLVHPYPEDTLHVSVSGGQETARTYVAFPTFLPSGGRFVGGTMELPLDIEPTSGSVSPETADFVACLSSTKFKPVRGSFEQPPKIECETRKAAVYNAEDAVFTVDLRPFAEHWKKDESALALVPSKAALERGDTWHAVYPAGEESGEPTGEPPAEEEPPPQISVTLEYETDAATTGIDSSFDLGTDTAAEPADPGGSFASSSGPSLDDGTGFTAAQGSTEVPEATTPTELPPEEAAPVASFVEGFAGPGFAYPIVWALPLLILVGLGAVGRALTKELYRRGL